MAAKSNQMMTTAKELARLRILLKAVLNADEFAGTTSVKPAGQPWIQVKAIPVELWEEVRTALSPFQENTGQ